MKTAALILLLLIPVLSVQAQECYDLSSRSAWIGLVCYQNGTMSVQMQGSTYKFCNVPSGTFAAFVNSSSPGTYYDQQIRHRYRCSGY